MIARGSSAPADPAVAESVLPVVGRDLGNRPLWIGLGVIALLGALLFIVLETRRDETLAPSVRPRASDLAAAPRDSVPPLYVPPGLLTGELRHAQSTAALAPTPPRSLIAPQLPVPPNGFGRVPPRDSNSDQRPLPLPQPSVVRADASPVIVFDGSASLAVGANADPANPAAPRIAVATRTGRLANRTTIIAQGTLIPAVLETALDSTQPGQARAMVTKNVANVLSGHVLIPRGSKLVGEYKGELQPGQRRAAIQWTRLIRPDGVSIAIDSPVADRLGRIGVPGKVDTHFLERLGGAMLQTSLDVGTLVASRAISSGSGVFVSVPGAVQGGGSQLVGTAPKPTLKVKAGTRIAVLVARDLDFTGVMGAR